MKGILEFNLPEDEVYFNVASNAMNYSIALEEIDLYLRNKLKYNELNNTQIEIYTEIRHQLHNILEERNIVL